MVIDKEFKDYCTSTKEGLFMGNVYNLGREVVYYDRKNDDELSVEDVADMVSEGVIDIDSIVNVFKEGLIDWVMVKDNKE